MTYRLARSIRPGMMLDTRNPNFHGQPVTDVTRVGNMVFVTVASGAQRQWEADREIPTLGGEYTPKPRQPRLLAVGDRVAPKTDLAAAGTVVALAEHKGYARGGYRSPGALKTATVYEVRWDDYPEAEPNRYFRSELTAISQ
ncbi:hypothetical protein [Streptomyces collinus]